MKKNKDKWYQHPAFPLIPILTIRAADSHNTWRFIFKWIFLKIWNLDTCSAEVAVVLDPTHWGIGFTIILPYLRIIATIPTTDRISAWFMRHTWRQSPAEKAEWYGEVEDDLG